MYEDSSIFLHNVNGFNFKSFFNEIVTLYCNVLIDFKETFKNMLTKSRSTLILVVVVVVLVVVTVIISS